MTAATTPPPDPDVERYLLLLGAQRSPRTVDAYRRDLAAAAHFVEQPIGAATTSDLERWVAQMRATGLAPSTIARRVAAVRSYFRHQQLLGSRSDNPAAEVVTPRRIRTLPRTLSASESERLMEAANGVTPRALRDRALIELMYGAGLRVSEAVGLARTSVDIDARIVRVIGKGDKERIVPLGTARSRVGPPLSGARPPSPGHPASARSVSERARRRADPGGRVSDPAQDRREGGPRAGSRAPTPPASLVRNAPPRGWCRSPFGTGDARPRRSLDDGALHACVGSPPARDVLRRSSARQTAEAGQRVGATRRRLRRPERRPRLQLSRRHR